MNSSSPKEAPLSEVTISPSSRRWRSVASNVAYSSACACYANSIGRAADVSTTGRRTEYAAFVARANNFVKNGLRSPHRSSTTNRSTGSPSCSLEGLSRSSGLSFVPGLIPLMIIASVIHGPHPAAKVVITLCRTYQSFRPPTIPVESANKASKALLNSS